MCMCVENQWARLWQETDNGKYPPAIHAPGCDEYKQEPFTRVTFDGVACVMEQNEAAAMLEESDEEYTVETVMITRDQFERMADFAGF